MRVILGYWPKIWSQKSHSPTVSLWFSEGISTQQARWNTHIADTMIPWWSKWSMSKLLHWLRRLLAGSYRSWGQCFIGWWSYDTLNCKSLHCILLCVFLIKEHKNGAKYVFSLFKSLKMPLNILNIHGGSNKTILIGAVWQLLIGIWCCRIIWNLVTV